MTQRNFNVTVLIERTTVYRAHVLLPIQAEDFGSAQKQADAAARAGLDYEFLIADSDTVASVSRIVDAGPCPEVTLPEGQTDLAPAYLGGVDRADGTVYQPVGREQILLE